MDATEIFERMAAIAPESDCKTADLDAVLPAILDKAFNGEL